MIDRRRNRQFQKKAWAYGLASAVLCCLGAERLWIRPTGDFAHDYHASVRELAAQIPISFDGWVGIDAPVPAAAIQILHPNVILSRVYQKLETGERVSFLLVQVSDARDILGHYPPVCYPAQGWRLDRSAAATWVCDQKPISGMDYEFAKERFDAMSSLFVMNILFLPGGITVSTMDDIERAAQTRRDKFFGAGQVQIVTDRPLEPAEKAELVATFMRLVQPILELPQHGVLDDK
jgi:hypothetical protein